MKKHLFLVILGVLLFCSSCKIKESAFVLIPSEPLKTVSFYNGGSEPIKVFKNVSVEFHFYTTSTKFYTTYEVTDSSGKKWYFLAGDDLTVVYERYKDFEN